METRPIYLDIQSELKENAKKETIYFPSNQELAAVVEKYDAAFVGSGAECVVLKPKENPSDFVVALDYKTTYSSEEARELFYRHRIMSTLFPHNFPRFMKSFGSHEENNFSSGTKRQKIDVKDTSTVLRLNTEELDNGATFPFAYVVEDIKALDLPVRYDRVNVNFGKTELGEVFYLDKIQRNDKKSWDKDAIKKYMDDQGFRDIEKKLVFTSINRLEEIENTVTAESQ